MGAGVIMQLRVIVQLYLAVALASILPVTCIIHCGLHDAHVGDTHSLYVCDMGHGMVDDASHTDVHATTRIPAVFELLSPFVGLWLGLWLLAIFVVPHQHLRGCVVSPLVPPPQRRRCSAFACGSSYNHGDICYAC